MPGSPNKVALGLAIGVFVGFTPTWPIQTGIALIVAIFLKGNKVTAAAGVWVSNPLTIPVLYPFWHWIGKSISPFNNGTQMPADWNLVDLLYTGWTLVFNTMVGGLLLGIIIAPLSYLIAHYYLNKLQVWQARRVEQSE